MSLLERVDRLDRRFASDLARHGERMALTTGATTLTYAALSERVEAVAHALGPERRLVLLTGANDLDAVVAYLGALRGGHPVLLVPADHDAHVERLAAAFDPDVVLTRAGGFAVEERRPGTAHDLHPDLALLLSTSGSTGSPRLVRLSHRNLQSNAIAIAATLDLSPADRAMTSLPMHYCYGLSVINSHLATGAGVVLTEASVVDPCFWATLREQEATSFAGVPHTFDLLERVGFESMALPSLRFVTQAGGRLAPDRVQRYAALGAARGWDLVVMYGQTEATARMAVLPAALAATRPGAIGLPIPGGAFTLAPVEGGRPDEGELVYRGDNVMLGYADTAADLAVGPTVGELHTGDLARRAPDGLYEIVGRRSRIAKPFGLRIDLDHLEELLREQAIDALCVGDDHGVVVAVTTEADGDAARVAAPRACGLPPSRLRVIVVPALPRLPNGKPDHQAVVEWAVREGGATVAPPTPPADVDPGVHRAVVEVLHRPDATAASTFVDLGGDSLSYVEMSIALEACLGELPAQWHTTPLGELVPKGGRARRGRQLELSVVLRAVSIVLVVGTHIKLFDVLGGAHLLLGIGGYNFARFRRRPSDLARSIARIAVPSMAWLAVASTINDRIHLPHVLLLNGWIGGDDAHGGYWYVEALVQILLPLLALLSIPAVRRLDRARPGTVPAALLAAGLLIRFHVVELPTVEPHDIRPHDIFWIFALGWVAAEARSTRARAVVSVVAVLAVPGYFGEPAREALVVAGLLLLVWVPTVRLPQPLATIVGRVAGASLFIYLTHWQVFPPLRDHAGPVVALVGSVGAGIALWAAVRSVGGVVRRVRQASVPA